jgi:DNA polymerase I
MVTPAFNQAEADIGGPLRAIAHPLDEITAQLRRWVLWPPPVLAVDIETAGLGVDARLIKCVTIADGSVAVVLDPRESDHHAILRGFVERTPAVQLAMHRSAFDFPLLCQARIMYPDQAFRVRDTLVYARMAWPDTLCKKNLEACAERLLGLKTEESIKDAFRRRGWSIREGYKRMDIDSPMFLLGAAVDAVITARLVQPLRDAAYRTLTVGHPFTVNGVTGDAARRLVEREQLVNCMMLWRSGKGLRVDLDECARYRASTADQLAQHAEILGSSGVRPGNAGDLVRVLEACGLLPEGHPRTAKTGRPSTTAKSLEALSAPLARAFVEHKRIEKIGSDYLQKVVDLSGRDDLGDDRIFPEVNILGATTGRMSYGAPPLQQFIGGARGIIIPDRGDAFTSIDWAQIEPVTIANISGDLAALEAYEDGSGDLYTSVAEAAKVKRKMAKGVLLAQLYGEGIGKLAADLDITTDQAKALRVSIFTGLPNTQRLLWKVRDIAARHRKIFTVSGRILPIPMGKGYEGGPPSIATHKAANYLVQGSAYDILAESLVAIYEAGLHEAVYLAMHDELVVSTAAAGDVRKIMETPPERLCHMAKRTPVLRTDRADLGGRWASC